MGPEGDNGILESDSAKSDSDDDSSTQFSLDDANDETMSGKSRPSNTNLASQHGQRTPRKGKTGSSIGVVVDEHTSSKSRFRQSSQATKTRQEILQNSPSNKVFDAVNQLKDVRRRQNTQVLNR